MTSISNEERANQYLEWLEEDISPSGIQRGGNNLNDLVYSESQ